MLTRLLGVLALPCACFAQTAAFEVASVKRSEPITPAKLSLYELIALAYQVKGHQISGPDWMVTERYDIQAKLPDGARRRQVPAMLQTLLADRFGMRLHRENRDLSVYALVVAGGGPRLKPSTSAAVTPQTADGPIQGGTTVSAGGTAVSTGPAGDSKITPGQDGSLHVENKKMTLARFAEFIGRYSELPVVDVTGLNGAYEMEFDVSGEEVRNAARAHGAPIPPRVGVSGSETPSDPSGVSLASSLRRLGLKLESRKRPAEVLVIDQVEKVPTPN